MRLGPSIRDWPTAPCLRCIQATGAPSGRTRSPARSAAARAGSRLAVTATCTLHKYTARPARSRPQAMIRSTARSQPMTSIGTPRTGRLSREAAMPPLLPERVGAEVRVPSPGAPRECLAR